ncbi:MAG: hypothetical protein Q9167_003319 [Letrouitia subvulpina]
MTSVLAETDTLDPLSEIYEFYATADDQEIGHDYRPDYSNDAPKSSDSANAVGLDILALGLEVTLDRRPETYRGEGQRFLQSPLMQEIMLQWLP